MCEVVCEEYSRHLNELRMERNAASQGYRSELDKVTRDLDTLGPSDSRWRARRLGEGPDGGSWKPARRS